MPWRPSSRQAAHVARHRRSHVRRRRLGRCHLGHRRLRLRHRPRRLRRRLHQRGGCQTQRYAFRLAASPPSVSCSVHCCASVCCASWRLCTARGSTCKRRGPSRPRPRTSPSGWSITPAPGAPCGHTAAHRTSAGHGAGGSVAVTGFQTAACRFSAAAAADPSARSQGSALHARLMAHTSPHRSAAPHGTQGASRSGAATQTCEQRLRGRIAT